MTTLKQISYLTIPLILVVSILIISHTTPSQPNPTSLIIKNSTVLTMEPGDQIYSSVRVDNGLISEISKTDLDEVESDVHTLDLGGRTLLPGFIDSHSHWIGDRNLVGLTSDEVIQKALSYGWTTISEQFVNQERLNELIQLDQEGRLILRVNSFLPINYQEQRFGEWYQKYRPHQMMSEKVRIAGVKFFMDNGPKLSNIDRNHWFTPEELNPLVKNAHDQGFQISIHAIIDNATDTALNAIQLAQGDNSHREFRHRIEHAAFLRDDQLDRINEMNTIISAQLLWFSSDWTEDLLRDSEEDPTENIHLLAARWRDVVDSGITLIGSTDTPWGVPEETLGSSILALSISTTREGLDQIEPPIWMENQKLSIEEALEAITINAAYGGFEEDVKGTIKVGKLGDFVVLSDNPIETDVEDLINLNVDMTIIGGNIVYCREELDDLCSMDIGTESTFSTSLQIDYQGNLITIVVIVIYISYRPRYKRSQLNWETSNR